MNKERKEKYLDWKRSTSILSNNIVNAFETMEKFEDEYGKDICEWNTTEIISYYKYLGTPHIQSLVQLNNALSSYGNWCVMNGLVRDNQNHFSDITTKMLCGCVDISLLKNMVGMLSRDTILSDIKELNNFSDQFIILGLFEGIPTADDVMKNVKLSDLDGNKLTLSNGNVLEVSDELIHIMRHADEEKEWICYHGTKDRRMKYIDDGCIIRFVKKNDDTPYQLSSSTVLIGSRLRRAVRAIGWPDTISMKTIKESGRIHMMKKLASEYGVSIEDTITKPSIRAIHEKIYGKIQNQKTYLSTYGVIIDSDS